MTDDSGKNTAISGTVIGPVRSGTFSGPVTIPAPRSLPLKYRTIVAQMVEDYSEVFGEPRLNSLNLIASFSIHLIPMVS